MKKATSEWILNDVVPKPKTKVRYDVTSPGSVSKWIQPKTSGKVMAKAMMQPHIISACARPRAGCRRKMKRLRAKSAVTRANQLRMFAPRYLGVKKRRQPRSQ